LPRNLQLTCNALRVKLGDIFDLLNDRPNVLLNIYCHISLEFVDVKIYVMWYDIFVKCNWVVTRWQ